VEPEASQWSVYAAQTWIGVQPKRHNICQPESRSIVSPSLDCSTNHRPSLALPASPAAPALPPLAGGDLAGPIYAIPYPKLLPPSAIPGRPSCSSAVSPSRTTRLRLGRRSRPSPGHRAPLILGGLPHRLACPRPRAWCLREDAARRRGHQDTRT
jgi:hypothetical protein